VRMPFPDETLFQLEFRILAHVAFNSGLSGE
jgi:hypothetical protein